MVEPAIVSRRFALVVLAIAPFAACVGRTGTPDASPSPQQASVAFADLERQYDSRLGVWARNTETGVTLSFRSDERFAMCSTFKVLAVGALLNRYSMRDLDTTVAYSAGEVLDYSPITATHVATGMSIRDLCAAAIEYSDNTAANLILDRIDGPRGVTDYVRSLGDKITQLDRNEPSLNVFTPGDPNNTSTPRAIGGDYEKLALGDALPADKRNLGFTKGASPPSWAPPTAWPDCVLPGRTCQAAS